MPFQKGNTFGKKGKPKGAVNRTTLSVKNAFLEAFEKRGGVKALLAWANDEPSEFYKIMGKMCPKELEVSGPNGGPITTRVEVAFVESSSDRKSGVP